MDKGFFKIIGELTWKQKKSFDYSHILPSSEAIGSKCVNLKVNCFTQFDPLKCVIVGYVDETATSPLQFIEIAHQVKYQSNKFPIQFIKKAQDDLNNLSQELMKLGVEVVRVGKKDWSKKFKIQQKEVKGYFCHSPRDIFFFYHNSMYQFPTGFPFRLEEYQVARQGSHVYYPWKSICQLEQSEQILCSKAYESQFQYFADAANLLKVGLDIIFLISQSASKGSYRIFRKFIQDKYEKKVRVHPLQNSYKGIHVDSSITLVGFNKKINKYIAFVDGLQATNPTNIPAIMRGNNWKLIQVNKYDKEFAHPDYEFVSDHMGLNFFMVNSELAIVSDNQQEIKKTLEFYGVKVLPLPIKHACQFDGGFHCATNDINREDINGFGKVLQAGKENLSKADLNGLFDPDLLNFLQQKGDIQNWNQICNHHGIFPQYLTDHLSQEEKNNLLHKHKTIKDNYYPLKNNI